MTKPGNRKGHTGGNSKQSIYERSLPPSKLRIPMPPVKPPRQETKPSPPSKGKQ
jgi:hypothetical protein